MDRTGDVDVLTPLERLRLRAAMQDLWRDQVRLITLLCLAYYDDPNTVDDRTAVAAGQRSETEDALVLARSRLAEFEHAMRRLDDRSYGLCTVCGSRVDFALLVQSPTRSTCAGCEPGVAPPRAPLAQLSAS